LQDKDIPDYVRVFRIHGPFLFGATDKLDLVHEQLDDLPPVVVLRLRNMTAIDATGLKVLEDLASKLHDSGRALLFCGALSQPRKLMEQASFDEHVGAENICPNIEAALQRAAECMREVRVHTS
jgi:SulP family sulfate permease